MLTKDSILREKIKSLSIYDDRGYRVNKKVEECMDEFARQIAIDFFNWQKKDYAECSADMSAEEWFDKYILQTSKK